jgi:hypothetical protein
MFADDKDERELDTTSEEIEDLDAPEQEGEDVKGGAPKIITPTKTSGCVAG